MKLGTQLIEEERQRQISQEGWTPEHDDGHSNGQLAIAGACYAMFRHKSSLAVMIWPWRMINGGGYDEPDGLKIKGELRSLVKAGALIAAEIDRLQRLEAQP